MPHVVNQGSLKQILRGVAKKICDLQDAPDDKDGQLAGHSWPPTIRLGRVMRPGFVAAGMGALDELEDLLRSNGAWSRYSIDDVIWDFIDRIVDLQPDQRQDGLRNAVEATAARFAEKPSSWVVDLLVYGLDPTCAGVRFGQVLLLAEDIGVYTQGGPGFAQFPSGIQTFARLEATAIDERSAIQRAEGTLDEHLMVINAICAREVPSLIQVSRKDHIRPFLTASRVARRGNSGAQVQTSGRHERVPLTGQQLRNVVAEALGGRMSVMLAASDNEFYRRVSLGYQFAGSACVDHHPERSFLMLAIALESAVLGDSAKSELTFQLGARMAHLIGNGLDGRKLVAATVSKLYDRRSRIVHAGQYGVSPEEAALMFFYCNAALAMLALAPSFKNFTKNAELEDWFKERILDGASHYIPDPSAETKEGSRQGS